MKNRIVLISFILLFGLVSLTGCTTNYGKSDIKKYIENDIGIKDFILADNPGEKTEKDGFTDYYWHVKYEPVEFNVINNYYYGM